ncbi:hypothetical protein Q5530_06150 [Saccharothrix sp. BKS2]|uniref:hypothetical protein n=1 Tax=Saccharothrix sp. BKS2 TaxID=3064400 RepID=UPI0039EA3B57
MMIDSSRTDSVPSAGEILERAAAEVSLSAQQVERALAEVNVVLKTPAVADRRIRVLQLTAEGAKKSGEAIRVRQRFGPGVWAIVHPANSAGKTSMLEFLVLPLRGAARDLPKDVRSWIRHLRLDAVLAGRPVRIAIDASSGWERTIRATIRSADTEQELVDAEDGHLRLLAEAVGLGEIERVIGEFMLDTLRMEHTQVWQTGGGADGEGAPQLHGWTAYFGACYLNPGGDKQLLGDVPAASLPGRLLELFVDLPYSTAMAELAVADKREKKSEAQFKRRADADAQARTQQRTDWQKELDETLKAITDLRSREAIDVSALLRDVDDTAEALRQARESFERTDQALRDARDARIRAEQAKLDATETWHARRVLGRLDPTCCPRCEEPLTADRRSQERDDAACAVCTRPLPEVDPEVAEALLNQLDENVTNATQAETDLLPGHQKAVRGAEQADTAYEAARRHLRETLTAGHPLTRLHQLELTAAGLRGKLSATAPAQTAPALGGSTIGAVLAAVHGEVRAVVDQAAKQILPEMDTEIVTLCERFGVQNLDSVRLTRAGQVNAVKDGEKTAFKDLSRGDRLRMRIATVIALLRIGADRGITSHPGLLLIDSIAAEELNAESARSLITELQAITSELPQLQVVFTTAHPEFVSGLLPEEHIITSTDDHLF